MLAGVAVPAHQLLDRAVLPDPERQAVPARAGPRRKAGPEERLDTGGADQEPARPIAQRAAVDRCELGVQVVIGRDDLHRRRVLDLHAGLRERRLEPRGGNGVAEDPDRDRRAAQRLGGRLGVEPDRVPERPVLGGQLGSRRDQVAAGDELVQGVQDLRLGERAARCPEDVLHGAAAVDEQRDLDGAGPGQREALALADQERHARDALDAQRRLDGQDLVQLQGSHRGRRQGRGHGSQQQVKGYSAPAALYIASASG